MLFDLEPYLSFNSFVTLFVIGMVAYVAIATRR